MKPPFALRRSVLALSLFSLALVAAMTHATEPGDSGLPVPLSDADYLYDGDPGDPLFELGRNLFFDPILSGNRNISCGTCHDPALGSGDGLALGIGEGGTGAGPERVTDDPVTGWVPRNAQPLWNIGARDYTAMFHDGRVEAIDLPGPTGGIRNPAGEDFPAGVTSVLAAQAFFPVTSPIEMAGQFGETAVADAAHREDRPEVWAMLAARVAGVSGYLEMLQSAFTDVASPDDVTYAHIAEALAAFQTVAFRSDESPFDAVLRTGDRTRLSPDAQAGLDLFFGEAGCAGCHSGPLLTDHKFHAIAVPQIGPGKGHGADMGYLHATGLPGRFEDEGRYRVTGDPADLFAFRTPSLRNVALTGPWGHSGAFDDLADMVRHHLDPNASLTAFDARSVTLPVLDEVLHMASRGSALSFSPVDAERRVDFDMRVSWVMETPELRERIAAANTLTPVDLTEREFGELMAFLEALTDPSAIDRTHFVPATVASGLPPQPIHSTDVDMN